VSVRAPCGKRWSDGERRRLRGHGWPVASVVLLCRHRSAAVTAATQPATLASAAESTTLAAAQPAAALASSAESAAAHTTAESTATEPAPAKSTARAHQRALPYGGPVRRGCDGGAVQDAVGGRWQARWRRVCGLQPGNWHDPSGTVVSLHTVHGQRNRLQPAHHGHQLRRQLPVRVRDGAIAAASKSASTVATPAIATAAEPTAHAAAANVAVRVHHHLQRQVHASD
jgi:hypothetical protein